MSKYALKLEQLVQTDAYGDILVTIQYDGQGPKLVTANGEGLDPELKHILDTVLGLINFSLAKGIAPLEIAEQIEIEPQDGIHLPINDVLGVVAESLREAPPGVEGIALDSLLPVSTEMIKVITQAGSINELNPNQFDNSSPSNQQETFDNNDDEGADSTNSNTKKEGGFFGGFSR